MASRGCQAHYRRPTPHIWTWCLCLLMYRVLTTVIGIPHTENIIQTTRSSWWNSALGCEGLGGKLYIPPSFESHQDLEAILDPGKTYWIGAMEYSTWTWTSDNSPLYEHTGYIQFPPSGKPTEIQGNAAFLCHLRCGKTYTRVGLSGKSCYCLVDKGYHTNIGKTVTEVRCPGNYDEWCGDGKGVSVYEIVDIDITQAPDGQCVYAKKNKKGSNLYSSSFHNDGNCSTQRSLAYTQTDGVPSSGRCRGSSCVEHGYRSWDQSEARYTLLKVSDANLDDLTDAMAYFAFSHNYYTYWIGLRRLYRRVWINGSDVNLGNGVHNDQHCLSIHKSLYNHTHLSWNPCDHLQMSVCQVARTLSSSTISDYSTMTSTPTSSPTCTPVAETGTSPGTDSPSTTHVKFTTSSSAIVQLNTGIRIGISVVCVAILAVTVAVFMTIKRRKLLFFGKKPKIYSDVSARFENSAYTTSSEEHIYDTVTEYPERHSQPPIPVATVRPMSNVYVNVPKSKEEGYDVLSQCSSFFPPSVKPYDRVVMGGDGTVSHGGYDRARISNGRPKFNSSLGLDDNGCPDQNEKINHEDDPRQVENGHSAKPARADDKNPTIPGSQMTYGQHQNRRVADPVYVNVSPRQQNFSNDGYVNMENVCRNAIPSHNRCYSNNGQVVGTEIAIEKDGRQRPREATDA
ncbi:uncharacterized protein [Haliotis asinina]|uniref:uncharacterized protein isoform X1 n=1 Tax=Haliotis asinina TaxID=109174 RepID=UPI003531AAFA